MTTPRELDFRMPAEWSPQQAIWLAWPHDESLWYGNYDSVLIGFANLVRELSRTERVRLLVPNESIRATAAQELTRASADPNNIEWFEIPTNDFWMRDNGPIFLCNGDGQKAIVDWGFNGWGGKYGPCDSDDAVPTRIAERFGLHCFLPNLILEGGSVDVDGEGTLLTTRQCLLNANRNPERTEDEIETLVRDYFGVDRVIWLDQGLASDHTDGHIDNLARFVGPARVAVVATEDRSHPDYESTRQNLDILRASRGADGRPLELTLLPLPAPTMIAGEEVSPSYANFIIANRVVLVPTYGLASDASALELLSQLFPTRRVIGLPSTDILSGGGSLHCISQQEPA